MCIRDRTTTRAALDEIVLGEATMADKLAAGEAVIEGSRETVSYTHLRAHETVLDLVCRLLLEKKNNTTELEGFTI